MSSATRVRPFDYEARPVRVIFGPGRIDEVDAECERLGIRRAMLIADSHAPGGGSLVTALGHRLAAHWDEISNMSPSSWPSGRERQRPTRPWTG